MNLRLAKYIVLWRTHFYISSALPVPPSEDPVGDPSLQDIQTEATEDTEGSPAFFPIPWRDVIIQCEICQEWLNE